MSRRATMTLFSVYKFAEGGPGQRFAMEMLRSRGIAVRPGPSPYVGQTGVYVIGGKRIQERAARILFGRA